MTARGRHALLVALLGAAGCAPCVPTADRPNVILVTIDTLRADHLGCYGSTSVRTPHLDRLAREGALFERAWAQTHVTVPSHLTILSSLPLVEHGVLDNGDRVERPVTVLSDLLAAAGWRTAAFVSAQHLGPRGPLGRLLARFDPYDAPGKIPRRAEETNGRLVRWLGSACREPFFAWVHYWDPHMPYAPPAPFDSAYYAGDPTDPSHDGMARVQLRWLFYDLSGARRHLAERPAEVRDLKRDLGLSSRRVRRLVVHPDEMPAHSDEKHRGRLDALAAHLRRRSPLRPHLTDWLTGVRDVRFPRARYAGEVSYVDREIGRLRVELERLGLAERTVVLVTADHGEALGEHGIWFTHYGLHEPALRVPLIVWAPGRIGPARYATPARGLDVAPTLLALAGQPIPPTMRGRDLLVPAPPTISVVAEAERGQQVMLLEGSWKLVRTLEAFHLVDAFARPAGAVELYDLGADPAELDDAAARQPETVARLGSELDAWLAAHRARPAVGGGPVPEITDQLRALGYVE